MLELRGDRLVCPVCGVNVPYRGKIYRHGCKNPCPHLGPEITRAGVVVKVKCGCHGKSHDQPHAAHECAIYKRCLPTLRPADLKAWEEREESKLYRCCHGCDRGIIAESGAE